MPAYPNQISISPSDKKGITVKLDGGEGDASIEKGGSLTCRATLDPADLIRIYTYLYKKGRMRYIYGGSTIKLTGPENKGKNRSKIILSQIDGGEGGVGRLLMCGGNGYKSVELTHRRLMFWDYSGQLSLQVFRNNLYLYDKNGKVSISLIGDEGDIKLSGADCAEYFDSEDSSFIDPGTVLVLNDKGGVSPCDTPYDRRVAGIASGANGLRPGVVLGHGNKQKKQALVSLTGTVYCRVNADFSPIEVGDLLTTSNTIGHAMKASDPERSFGAVLGKAMGALSSGQGLMPVLIALQ